MSHRPRRVLLRLRHGLLAAALCSALAAHAQTTNSQLDLPAAPLEQSLNALARQTGAQILFSSDLVANKRASTLRGNHTPRQGLEQLLLDSGLRAEERSPGVFVVLPANPTGKAQPLPATQARPASDASPDQTLETIEVRGTRLDDNYTVESSSSATGLDLSMKETPQSITTFTAQQIQDQGLLTLAEVLDQTPGITLVSAGVSGAGSQPIYARTFPVTSIQMDGIMASTYILSGSANGDIGMQDSFLYDRIDIIRGSNSLTGGAGDPSASLNFVRKHPGYGRQLSTALKYGSWDNTRLEVDATTPLNQSETWRVRVAGAAQQGDHWVDRVSSDRLALSLISVLDLGERDRLSIGGTWFDYQLKGASPHGVTRYSDITDYNLWLSDPVNRNRTQATSATHANYNNATPWSRADREYLNLFASWEHDFTPDWNLKLSYNYANNTDDKLYGEMGTRYYVPEHDRASYTARRENRENEVHAIDARLKGSFSLFGREHDLVVGANSYEVEHRIHWGYAMQNGPAAGDASLVIGGHGPSQPQNCSADGWWYQHLKGKVQNIEATFAEELASWEVMRQMYLDDPTMEEWWGPLDPQPTMESVKENWEGQWSRNLERCDQKSGISIAGWETSGGNIAPYELNGRDLYNHLITTHMKSRQYGAYFAAHLRPLDRTHLILGGRWHRDRQEDPRYTCVNPNDALYKGYCDGTYAANGTLRRNTPPELEPKFLPYAGLIYEITPQINAYASYTTTYVRDINSNNTISLASGAWLPPVRSITHEGGFKGGFFDNRLNLAAAYFLMKQKDFPFHTQDSNAPQTTDDGWEVEGWELSASGSITPNWNITGGYVKQKQRVPRNEGEVLLGARDDFTGSYRSPERSLKLFSTYRVDALPLMLGVGYRWQSETESAWIPPNKTTAAQQLMRQDAFDLIDVMARWQINDHLSLQLNANNILGKAYYQHERSYISGAPRNYLLTVTWRK